MRKQAAVAACLALVLTSCTGQEPAERNGATVRTQPKADLEQATRRHISTVITAVNAGTPDASTPQLLAVPCNGPSGDGMYYVSGQTTITAPADQHRHLVTQARDTLEMQGYAVTSYRDLTGPTGAEAILSDPSDGTVITLASSGDRVWLALLVRSACVLPPDGNYPG